MPRGDNPNSRKNLIKNSERTPEERTAQARKAGKASGKSRAAAKSFTDTLKEALTDEKRKKIADVLISRASAGNLKAIEMIRDTIGEKPRAQVEVSGTLEEKKSKLEDLIGQLDGGGDEQ